MVYSTVKIILICDTVKRLLFQRGHSLGAHVFKQKEEQMEDARSKHTVSPDSQEWQSRLLDGDVISVNSAGSRRGRGRPKLDVSERRKKLNLIYLTDAELHLLRQQHIGPSQHFGTFLRNKLLVKKTFVVPREIDPDVRNEIRNLLKLTGSINLIALKTKGDIEVTEDFKKTSSLIRSIASAAKKSVDHSVQLMEVAPSILEQLNDLLRAVDYVEYGFSDFELLRAGIGEVKQSLEPLIRKFER